MNFSGTKAFLMGSLRRQLVLGVAAVHAVMMTLFVADLTWQQKDMVLDQQTSLATAVAQSVATSSGSWLAARDFAGLQEIIETQRRYPELSFAMALDTSGKILAHTDRSLLGLYVRDMPAKPELRILSRNPTLVDVVNPVMVSNHQVGWVRIGIGQRAASEKLAEIIHHGIFYALSAIFIGVLLAMFMARRFTRRLKKIQDVADGVQTGNSDARVSLKGGDEAAHLARSFNAMLDALAQREQQVQTLNNELEQRVAERTAQLSTSNEELERFAHIASHDLQEPLRTVASYLQLVERRYHDKLDDDGREFIHYAVDGAARMQDLIKDLLEFSRVQTQGKPMAPVDLNTVLGNVLTDLKVAIEENGAIVEHTYLPRVMGDEGQLRRLLQNLVGNGLKYRREGRPPNIHISARRIEGGEVKLPDNVPGKGWLISVKDNGIGIESKYYEKVFQLFQRLHTRKDYPGTGLGLALCKRIVERHGGAIWVDSTPGEGSVFYCAFPDLMRESNGE